jgi:hypothetical protein
MQQVQPRSHRKYPLDNRPSVLVVAAKWWPLSARLAAALIGHGCRVSALCPKGHPLTKVSGLAGIRRYAAIRSLPNLAQAVRATGPDIVVPCDDGAVAQLQSLHQNEAPLRDLIERSLGDPQSFPIVGSRYRLLSAAQDLGITVPETRSVASIEGVKAWHEHISPSAVLKLDGESGGNGVWICTTLDECLAAWREASAPPSLAAACKRVAIDGDPLALWARGHRPREITLQRIIEGRPANSMMACREGKVLSLVSVVVLASDGPTGASTIVQRIHDDRMAHAAHLLAGHLMLNGFYGLDFMIEAGSGTPYLIEMNPRCTQLGHLEFKDQGSLAGAFVADMRGEPSPPARHPIPLDTVALFPQSLEALNNGSRYRTSSYLDAPRDALALLDELKMPPFPLRRWPARLYHALRPVKRTASVEYERPFDVCSRSKNAAVS